MDRYKTTAIGISIVVLTTIIAALQTIDNPLVEADQKKDQKRMQDFSQIFYTVQSYYQERERLPDNLNDLRFLPAGQKTDASTGKEYEYNVISKDTFKLCTEFATDNSANDENNRGFGPSGDIKTHKQGYDCIEYTVETLPPIEKPRPL